MCLWTFLRLLYIDKAAHCNNVRMGLDTFAVEHQIASWAPRKLDWALVTFSADAAVDLDNFAPSSLKWANMWNWTLLHPAPQLLCVL